jgi:hypothetical protein
MPEAGGLDRIRTLNGGRGRSPVRKWLPAAVGMTISAALALSALEATTYARAQQSIFPLLVGEWNHLESRESIRVTRTGDVWATGGPQARVGNTIQAGGNFAFEGRTNTGELFRCVYYITFLQGNASANWRVVSEVGTHCPDGMFVRVSGSQP